MRPIRLPLLPAAALSLALLAATPARADRIIFEDDTGRVVNATLLIDGTPYSADWYLPAGTPVGLAQIQHGFTRRCANLRDTTLEMMRRGLMGLCLNASMANGNPALANALAQALVAGLSAPDGRPVPERVVVGGHSAGGMFASRLGATLQGLAPERLAGAVLFDPVASDGSYGPNLAAISDSGQRPVLAVSANGSACNAFNNGEPALAQVSALAQAAGRDGFVGLRLTDNSTHVDAEGGNTTRLAWVTCLQGPPRAPNVAALRALAPQWAADAALGQRTPEVYPGGAVVDDLLARGAARPIP
jgi:pimeloyl-ACP methyl ester carboxylesterase